CRRMRRILGIGLSDRAICTVQRIESYWREIRRPRQVARASAREKALARSAPLSPPQDAPERAANNRPANRAAHRAGDRLADVGRDLPGDAVGDRARDLAGDQLTRAQTLAASARGPEDLAQDASNLADPASRLRSVSGVIRGGRFDAFFQDLVS